jgi:hypothetical protein
MANGKYTLLQVVQKTLDALGSDSINSLSDTAEGEQIAQIAEDAYYELLNQKDWPFLQQLTELESLADANFPNYLRIPDDIVRIVQLKYDFTNQMVPPEDTLLTIRELVWLSPQHFLNKTQGRNTDQDNTIVITSMNGIKIPIFNNTEAQWWTSFDDEFVIIDAWHFDFESTIQGGNSQVLAKTIPAFEKDNDDFVPFAPAHFFQIWLAEVKRMAFFYFRQDFSMIDEQKARRGLAVMRRDASRTNQSDGKVHFGRPARAGTLSGTSDICANRGSCDF